MKNSLLKTILTATTTPTTEVTVSQAVITLSAYEYARYEDMRALNVRMMLTLLEELGLTQVTEEILMSKTLEQLQSMMGDLQALSNLEEVGSLQTAARLREEELDSDVFNEEDGMDDKEGANYTGIYASGIYDVAIARMEHVGEVKAGGMSVLNATPLGDGLVLAARGSAWEATEYMLTSVHHDVDEELQAARTKYDYNELDDCGRPGICNDVLTSPDPIIDDGSEEDRFIRILGEDVTTRLLDQAKSDLEVQSYDNKMSIEDKIAALRPYSETNIVAKLYTYSDSAKRVTDKDNGTWRMVSTRYYKRWDIEAMDCSGIKFLDLADFMESGDVDKEGLLSYVRGTYAAMVYLFLVL